MVLSEGMAGSRPEGRKPCDSHCSRDSYTGLFTSPGPPWGGLGRPGGEGGGDAVGRPWGGPGPLRSRPGAALGRPWALRGRRPPPYPPPPTHTLAHPHLQPLFHSYHRRWVTLYAMNRLHIQLVNQPINALTARATSPRLASPRGENQSYPYLPSPTVESERDASQRWLQL